MIIRDLDTKDKAGLLNLYQQVATNPRGIARSQDEITEKYIQGIYDTVENSGISKVLVIDDNLVGEIHVGTKDIYIFRHVLSGLTVGVHPHFQRRGFGKMLFQALLEEVRNNRPEIYRVELESRAANSQAVSLYKSVGFIEEGRMVKQTLNRDGTHEDGVFMAWFNPNYKALI